MKRGRGPVRAGLSGRKVDGGAGLLGWGGDGAGGGVAMGDITSFGLDWTGGGAARDEFESFESNWAKNRRALFALSV